MSQQRNANGHSFPACLHRVTGLTLFVITNQQLHNLVFTQLYYIKVKVYVKVKFTLEQNTKAQRGVYIFTLLNFRGTRWRSWLSHCATYRKVAGSIPNGVIGIFH
jgi:hypothetical protein